MRSVVVIPARYGSSRFPGKPITPILSKPLIIWVAELSERAVGIDNVYIATDDYRIEHLVRAAGFQTVLTSSSAMTGTDRIAEAAREIEADIFLNVQGDEPLVHPGDILKVRNAKRENMNRVVNAYALMSPEEDPSSLNIPKVITDEKSNLIYMSRALIPGFKDPHRASVAYKKQVCIYGMTRDELRAFAEMGRKSTLEEAEDIEILRFLELDRKVHMVETASGSLAVDVPSDVLKVEKEMKRRLGLQVG